MTETALVGITGYAQHGKDSTGKRLVEKFGYHRFAFADQLRALALDIDPIIEYEVPYEDHIRVEYDNLAALVQDRGYEAAKALPEVRRFLVALGIGVRNRIGADAWVDALQREVDLQGYGIGRDNIVITDVRFPNEASFVQNHGILIRVTKPGREAVPHDNPAEVYVKTFKPDIDIVANDLDELYAEVDTAMLAMLTWGHA